MNKFQEDVAALINVDPLANAEKITGKSYKDDEDTGLLGMLIQIEHSKKVNRVLSALDDTVLSNKLDRYIRIITEMGFEVVLEIPFMSKVEYSKEPAKEEKYFIFMHREKGLLLHFDTYWGQETVNGATLIYSWYPTDRKEAYKTLGLVRSSGGYHSESNPHWEEELPDDAYIAGSLDAREALRYKVSNLEERGKFLNPFPKLETRFWWLLHHMDTKTKGYDYKAISQERIAMLPDWARKIINL